MSILVNDSNKIRVGVKEPNELSASQWAVWDASDFNLVTDLTAVTTWNDKYLSGRNLIYVGTGAAPYISTERLNGMKLVECGAVDSRMSITPTYTSDFTCSIVCKNVTPFLAGYRGINFGAGLRVASSTNYGLSSNLTPNFQNPSAWSIITFTRTSNVLSVYVNRVLQYSVSNSTSLSSTAYLFGDASSFGQSIFMKTLVAEVNVFNFGLTSDDVIKNQTYLKLKWGL